MIICAKPWLDRPPGYTALLAKPPYKGMSRVGRCSKGVVTHLYCVVILIYLDY